MEAEAEMEAETGNGLTIKSLNFCERTLAKADASLVSEQIHFVLQIQDEDDAIQE